MNTLRLIIKWLPVIIGMIPEIVEFVEKMRAELEEEIQDSSTTKKQVKEKAKQKIKEV